MEKLFFNKISDRKLTVRVFFWLRSIFQRFHIFVRIYYYKRLGATIGRRLKLGSVFMPIPEQIFIGDDCNIEDQVRLRAGGKWKEASIFIGKQTFIGHGTQINVRGHFKIGNDCLIAPLCIFTDTHHKFTDLNIPIRNQETFFSEIEIKDNVWIGSGVIVLGGVVINTGAVIAAGAVVNCSIPAFEIWGGIPAKKIKSRI